LRMLMVRHSGRPLEPDHGHPHYGRGYPVANGQRLKPACPLKMPVRLPQRPTRKKRRSSWPGSARAAIRVARERQRPCLVSRNVFEADSTIETLRGPINARSTDVRDHDKLNLDRLFANCGSVGHHRCESVQHEAGNNSSVKPWASIKVLAMPRGTPASRCRARRWSGVTGLP
jgi:hypothetical protein